MSLTILTFFFFNKSWSVLWHEIVCVCAFQVRVYVLFPWHSVILINFTCERVTSLFKYNLHKLIFTFDWYWYLHAHRKFVQITDYLKHLKVIAMWGLCHQRQGCVWVCLCTYVCVCVYVITSHAYFKVWLQSVSISRRRCSISSLLCMNMVWMLTAYIIHFKFPWCYILHFDIGCVWVWG